MPTPSEINRKARNVNSVKDDLSSSLNRCQGCTYNSASWWQNEAGKVLRSEYSEIQADVSRFFSRLSTLESQTHRLADNVQEALDERRRRRAKKTKCMRIS